MQADSNISAVTGQGILVAWRHVGVVFGTETNTKKAKFEQVAFWMRKHLDPMMHLFAITHKYAFVSPHATLRDLATCSSETEIGADQHNQLIQLARRFTPAAITTLDFQPGQWIFSGTNHHLIQVQEIDEDDKTEENNQSVYIGVISHDSNSTRHFDWEWDDDTESNDEIYLPTQTPALYRHDSDSGSISERSDGDENLMYYEDYESDENSIESVESD